jgi:hypothetical protein
MRIECLEPRLLSDGYALTEGDLITVPDEVGARWCALGWARDAAGVVPTGERRVLDARLSVQGAQAQQDATQVSHG